MNQLLLNVSVLLMVIGLVMTFDTLVMVSGAWGIMLCGSLLAESIGRR